MTSNNKKVVQSGKHGFADNPDNLTYEKSFKLLGFDSQRRYPNEQTVQFLAAHYFGIPRKHRKNIKILEVGCGSGANLWAIAREGFNAYGLDIAKSSLSLCKKMLRSYGVKANLTIGNFRALPYKDGFFDAIVDVLSIEHTTLAGHEEAFAEIFRCLKSGGRFFSWHLGAESVSFKQAGGVKLDRCTIDNVSNTDVPYHNNGITCFLTVPLAKRMLTEAGFRDIHIERTLRSYRNMTQEIEYFAIKARKP